jgi:hypothetical protein
MLSFCDGDHPLSHIALAEIGRDAFFTVKIQFYRKYKFGCLPEHVFYSKITTLRVWLFHRPGGQNISGKQPLISG